MKEGKGNRNRKREGTKKDWIMHEYVYHQKRPAPPQWRGPDLQLLPFCLGPDSQLSTSSKLQKIGVAAKRVQEQYAPTLYNEEIQETREMINNTGFEWSEVVVGGVHQEPMVEKDCWFQQRQPEEPLDEYDAKELKIDSEALVVSPLQQQKEEQTLEKCDDNFNTELSLGWRSSESQQSSRNHCSRPQQKRQREEI
ncbi:hypothetical protein SLEP1_g14425 [Rubroshorea leprosula]|uniref:NAC domain-containing protein n=1 Tax=Rubroshorea leprosula TaxID=152421 RepID=A0AAV5IUK0_9ROSI|nr:hypothetical protein SLEP1_g14425 [Rubroshorea leprosula]